DLGGSTSVGYHRKKFSDITLSSIGKNSGEAKRSPTSMSNLSFMDTINQRSRGSGHEQVL
ncbi:MAG: hypothetical protein ACLBM6_01560, partial [Cuspidothrix sp.]